jgi:cellulose synthase/poly-beta-1,6-N-acetylglucosamine synthase-like glycosyltransferase
MPLNLKVMAGIAAHNEEKNIGSLLSVLVGEKDIDSIIVVSSSTDNTNEIVAKFAEEKKSKVHLVVEEERKGKSSAFNKILDECQKKSFDIIVYTGGDALPAAGSVGILLKEFETGRVGVVGGKPEPIDTPESFLGWTTNLQWNMLHEISERFEPKVCGDLMAFRADVIKEIPIAIINDDAYVQLTAETKSYETKYCPAAVVKFKGCSTIKDHIVQRRRIYLGYMQLLFLAGVKLSTFKWRYYHKVLRKSLPSFGFKQVFYLIGAIALQFWAYLLALKDFHLFRLPYKWEIAKSTKESISV